MSCIRNIHFVEEKCYAHVKLKAGIGKSEYLAVYSRNHQRELVKTAMKVVHIGHLPSFTSRFSKSKLGYF